MQREKMKERVKKGIQKAASATGRGIWGATRYVGRVAGRKLKEGVERTFNEPINERDREAFERSRQTSSRRYWTERARQEYRENPKYVMPSATMFGGGNKPVSMLGSAPSGKKRKEVSMI